MPPADLAVLGAAIRTLDPARPAATAVAVRDGLIVAVGDDAEVREHAGPSTELIDGRGMALVPGLVDSHIHPFHGSDGTRGADLNGLRTLDEVRGALAAERARCGPGDWLLGWGLSYDVFHGDRIGADAIADATGDSARLPHVLRLPLGPGEPPGARAGRRRRRARVRRRRRGRVRRRRRPDRRAARVARHGLVARPSRRSRRRAARRLRRTLRRLNALGLTGVHEMLGMPRMSTTSRRSRRAATSRPLVVPLLMQPDVTDEEIEALLAHSDRARRGAGAAAWPSSSSTA